MFTTQALEPVAAIETSRALDSVRVSVHVEESPCIEIKAIDLIRAVCTPWRPRTMQAWLT